MRSGPGRCATTVLSFGRSLPERPFVLCLSSSVGHLVRCCASVASKLSTGAVDKAVGYRTRRCLTR